MLEPEKIIERVMQQPYSETLYRDLFRAVFYREFNPQLDRDIYGRAIPTWSNLKEMYIKPNVQVIREKATVRLLKQDDEFCKQIMRLDDKFAREYSEGIDPETNQEIIVSFKPVAQPFRNPFRQHEEDGA